MKMRNHWRCLWVGRKTDIWGSQNICFYCGQRADTVDHVVPQSMIRILVALEDKSITKDILRRKALKVWACRECNSLAGDTYQENLEERRQYVKDKLRRRYRKLIALPPWSESELNEIGYTLQTHIVAAQNAREFVKKRIAW